MGVFSFLLVDLPALVALLPVTAGAEIPQITPAIKLLSLIQPAMLLSLAVFTGVALAHRVGLSSPVAEAAASGHHVWPALKLQIVPGIIGGLSGGVAVVAVTLLTKPWLSAETVERIAAFGNHDGAPRSRRHRHAGNVRNRSDSDRRRARHRIWKPCSPAARRSSKS
jgi:hypothetical protein